jgi:hypothetical protein
MIEKTDFGAMQRVRVGCSKCQTAICFSCAATAADKKGKSGECFCPKCGADLGRAGEAGQLGNHFSGWNSFRSAGIPSSEVRLSSNKEAAAEKESKRKYGNEKYNKNWISILTDYLKQLGIIANFKPIPSNPKLHQAIIQHMGITMVVLADYMNFLVVVTIGKVPKQNAIELFAKLLTYNTIVPGVYFSLGKVQDVQVRGGRNLEGLDVHELKILLDGIGRFILQFALPIVKEFRLSSS